MPNYVEIFLVIALAWLTSLWWQGQVKEPIAALVPTAVVTASMDTSKLIKTAIFGEPQHEVIKKKKIIQAVVVSQLKLKLLATVVAGDRSAAVVVLNHAGQQVFFLGDTMLAGVSLENVEVAAITVNNHGKLERIELSKSAPLKGAKVSGKKVVKQHVLRRTYLDSQIKNLPKLLSQARVVPHFENGKSDGFVIIEIVAGSLYQSIGLKNGDILRKVNGVAITGTQQAMKMYQDLQSATVIDLELLRNGVMMPIHYNIR